MEMPQTLQGNRYGHVCRVPCNRGPRCLPRLRGDSLVSQKIVNWDTLIAVAKGDVDLGSVVRGAWSATIAKIVADKNMCRPPTMCSTGQGVRAHPKQPKSIELYKSLPNQNIWKPASRFGLCAINQRTGSVFPKIARETCVVKVVVTFDAKVFKFTYKLYEIKKNNVRDAVRSQLVLNLAEHRIIRNVWREKQKALSTSYYLNRITPGYHSFMAYQRFTRLLLLFAPSSRNAARLLSMFHWSEAKQ